MESAALEGVIYELDGQTIDRSGISVTVLETGESVLTGADGTFEFAVVPAGDHSGAEIRHLVGLG